MLFVHLHLLELLMVLGYDWSLNAQGANVIFIFHQLSWILDHRRNILLYFLVLLWTVDVRCRCHCWNDGPWIVGSYSRSLFPFFPKRHMLMNVDDHFGVLGENLNEFVAESGVDLFCSKYVSPRLFAIIFLAYVDRRRMIASFDGVPTNVIFTCSWKSFHVACSMLHVLCCMLDVQRWQGEERDPPVLC